LNEIIAPSALSTALVLVALENLGIPYPTEASYLAVMAFVKAGKLDFPTALAAVSAAHVVGALIAYELSRSGRGWVGRWARRRQRTDVAYKVLERWFQRYGLWAILGARVVGYVRPWASLAAGIAGMARWPFLGATVVGSIAHTWMALLATGALIYVWVRYPFLKPALIIGGVISIWGIWVVGWLRARRRAAARREEG
jgi:membrane protein DedA with SNARE-associated domain